MIVFYIDVFWSLYNYYYIIIIIMFKNITNVGQRKRDFSLFDDPAISRISWLGWTRGTGFQTVCRAEGLNP